jgi:hypothetical protein
MDRNVLLVAVSKHSLGTTWASSWESPNAFFNATSEQDRPAAAPANFPVAEYPEIIHSRLDPKYGMLAT